MNIDDISKEKLFDLVIEYKQWIERQGDEIKTLTKELETCKTIIALANIAWDKKFGKELHQ